MFSPLQPQKLYTTLTGEMPLSEKIKKLHSHMSYLVQLFAFHEVMCNQFSFSTSVCNLDRWCRVWNTCWDAVSQDTTLISLNNFNSHQSSYEHRSFKLQYFFSFNICPLHIKLILVFCPMLTKRKVTRQHTDLLQFIGMLHFSNP